MRDDIAKAAYDRGYNEGEQHRISGERKRLDRNPYRKTKWGNGRDGLWEIGYLDGWRGMPRAMSQKEAKAKDDARTARLEEIVRQVAALSTSTDRVWNVDRQQWVTFRCPICQHIGATDEHYPSCPLPLARALVDEETKAVEEREQRLGLRAAEQDAREETLWTVHQ